MAAKTTSKGITTSFASTPQAHDDTYSWSENALLTSGLLSANVMTLDVTANDFGGNAKSLLSVDDGNGRASLTDYDLLSADNQGVWERTARSNRIANAQPPQWRSQAVTRRHQDDARGQGRGRGAGHRPPRSPGDRPRGARALPESRAASGRRAATSV